MTVAVTPVTPLNVPCDQPTVRAALADVYRAILTGRWTARTIPDDLTPTLTQTYTTTQKRTVHP